MEKHTIEKDIAAYIKKEYEKKYAPSFHCIVGKDYGCFITHESGHFIYINVDRYGILLFKSGQTQWKTKHISGNFSYFFPELLYNNIKKKSSMNVDDNTTLIFVILFLCMGTYSFIYLCVYFIELINVRIQVNEISPIMAT